jgi:NAD(P)-dependent dehydrogenase (short-subunit alcohol dehydrogenase family)
MTQLTWLITGCSSGLGEELAKSALKRGDKVIASARGNVDRIKSLKDLGAATLVLDVCSTQETLDRTIQEALAVYGDIDVLVNNAGYIEAGLLEGIEYVHRYTPRPHPQIATESTTTDPTTLTDPATPA